MEARNLRAAAQNVQLRSLPEGYLFKQGSMIKNWKKRYFVIDFPQEASVPGGIDKYAGVRRRLLYFTQPGGELKGEFILDNTIVRIDSDATRAYSFSLVSAKKSLYLQASNDDEREHWACELDRNYRMQEERKKFGVAIKLLSEGQWFRKQEDATTDDNEKEHKKGSGTGTGTGTGTADKQRVYVTLNASQNALTRRSETSSIAEETIPLSDIRHVSCSNVAISNQQSGGGTTCRILTITFCLSQDSNVRRTSSGSFRMIKKGKLETNDANVDATEVADVNNKRVWKLSQVIDNEVGGNVVNTVQGGAVDVWYFALIDVRDMLRNDRDRGRKSALFDSQALCDNLNKEEEGLLHHQKRKGSGPELPPRMYSTETGNDNDSNGHDNNNNNDESKDDVGRSSRLERVDTQFFSTTIAVGAASSPSNSNSNHTRTTSSSKKARGKSARNAQANHIGPCLQHALYKYLVEEQSGDETTAVATPTLSSAAISSTAISSTTISSTTSSSTTSSSKTTKYLPELTSDAFQAKMKMSATCEFPSISTPVATTVDMEEPNDMPTPTPTMETKEYDFRSYAPQVFRRLRRSAGIDNMSFAKSMSELSGGAVGEGKSGMVFFRSKDGKYIMKTLKESEKNFFYHRGVLEAYWKYMEGHSNTLLCSFYGLFKIRFNKSKKKNDWIVVIVMENAFNTRLTLHSKYDLKGSTKNRFVTADEIARGCSVLKDLNFNSKIYLDKSDAVQFVHQAEEDAAFLASYNMMDYSLLLGVHTPDLVDSDDDNETSRFTSSSPSSSSSLTLKNGRDRWRRHCGGIEGRSPTPNRQNEVYYVSIIDFLQLYDTSKKLENALKGKILGKEREVSAVSGAKYAERFVNYVKTITEGLSGVLTEENKVKREREELARQNEEIRATAFEKEVNVKKKNELVEKERQDRLQSEMQVAEAERLASFLSKVRSGISVLKHPRKGKPSKRLLVLRDGILGLIEKADDVKGLQKKGYRLQVLRGIQRGHTTAVFARTSAVAPIAPEHCLSVLVDARSLDIQCNDEEEREELYYGLSNLMATHYTLDSNPQQMEAKVVVEEKVIAGVETKARHHPRKSSVEL